MPDFFINFVSDVVYILILNIKLFRGERDGYVRLGQFWLFKLTS